MTKTAERQRRFKQAKARAGLTRRTLWLPEGCMPEVLALERILQNPNMAPISVTVQDVATGRLASVRLK